MAYKLEKPYTQEARIKFIAQYNRNMGLAIQETNDALFALEAWEIMENGQPIKNPNYEKEIEQRKKEQLMMSNMTKLDFVNALEPFGVNYYEHIVLLLNSNLEAKKQWDLCERVYRFNPLLDELAKGFGVTPNQLDKIFGGQ
jgi:hypothetical protein